MDNAANSNCKINPDLQMFARRLTELTPDDKNARIHPETNLESIRRSYEGFRQQKPVVVRPNGKIIAGNGQYFAAKALGWTHIAAVTFDGTDDEAQAYGIADNQTALTAEWDDDALAELVQETDEDLRDMLGFDDDALEGLLVEATPEGETDSGEEGADATAQSISLAPTEEDLHKFEDKYVLIEFSGGKDSTAALAWCMEHVREVAEDITLLYVDLGADYPGIQTHVYQVAKQVQCNLRVLRSEDNIIDVILTKGDWPGFIHPYCHDLLHQALDAEIERYEPEEVIVVRGGRRSQKAARSNVATDRWMTVKHLPNYIFYQPYYFASDSEVMQAIAHLPQWSGYSKGLCRTACRICPGQRPIAYAAIREHYPDIWDELLYIQSICGPGAWNRTWAGKGVVPTFEAMAARGALQEVISDEQ